MDQASSVSTLSPLSSSLVMSPTPSFLDLSFSLNSKNSSSTSAVNVSGDSGNGQLPLSSSCSSLSSSTSTISDYATGICKSMSLDGKNIFTSNSHLPLSKLSEQ